MISKLIFGPLMAAAIAQKKADFLGVLSSILCLVHCLIPPAILLSSNALSHYADHLWFDVFFALFSAIAVYLTTRGRQQSWISVMLWVSLLSLVLGLGFEELVWMRALSYAAAVGLIIGHSLNIRQSFRSL